MIRVQAEEILKARLKQEFDNEFNNRMSHQLEDLKKKIGDLENKVDTLKSENTKRKRQIERLEFSNRLVHLRHEDTDLSVKIMVTTFCSEQ